MSLHQYCCLCASAWFLAACQTSTAPEQLNAAFLVGQDSGEAMRYFGPPSHGAPPAVTGGVLSWQAALVFAYPTANCCPFTPLPLRHAPKTRLPHPPCQTVAKP